MAASAPSSAQSRAFAPAAHYPALDGLRATALASVFLLHYGFITWGGTGVNVFFVLSGFLITGILWDTRNDLHKARKFYTRRMLRIFPLFYGIMLLLLLTWPVLHWRFTAGWLLWPAYLGNFIYLAHYVPGSALQNLAYFQPVGEWHGREIRLFLGHFWTLCIEEQFYLVWPWVVFSLRRRVLLWICGLSVPVCLMLRVAAIYWLPSWMINQGFLSLFTPLMLDALLLGAFLALLLRGPRAAKVLQLASLALPAALFLLFVWSCLRAFHSQWCPTLPVSQASAPTLINLLSALLVLVALQGTSWLTRILSVRPLRWMGRISYGAYVFHDIPHMLYAHMATHIEAAERRVAIALLGFAATLCLAALSFRFYETPFLRLKDKLAPKTAQAEQDELEPV